MLDLQAKTIFPLFTWGRTRAVLNWFYGNQLPLLKLLRPPFIYFGIAWFSVVHASVRHHNWSGFWACLVDIFKWMHPPHVITEKRWWMAFQTPCYYTFLIYLPVPFCKTTSNEFYSKPTKKKSNVELTKKKSQSVMMIMMVTKKCCFWKMIKLSRALKRPSNPFCIWDLILMILNFWSEESSQWKVM